MMQYKAFSICMHALTFPENPAAPESRELLSDSSAYMLQKLYNTLNEKLKKAGSVSRAAKNLTNNIFCCCMPEGMVMLANEVNEQKKSLRMNGFLVPDESLRTAWRLCRVQLLYLCAGGWRRTGEVRLTLSEIDQLAGSVSISQETAASLNRMAEAMLGSEAPFSFAMTKYSLSQLPLQFSDIPAACLAVDGAVQEDVDEIPLSANEISFWRERYFNAGEYYRTLLLHHTSKKKYAAQFNFKSAPSDEQKRQKAELKGTLDQYQYDEIWYLQVSWNHKVYTAPLRPYSSDQLCKGYTDFAVLHNEVSVFLKNAGDYFHALAAAEERRREMERKLAEEELQKKRMKMKPHDDSAAQNGTDLPPLRRVEQNKQVPPKKQESEKKHSVFGKLFGKRGE